MAKQKHNIAHGIIEFTSEGLRQVKKEFKELEKEIKGFKSGDVIDRNKAMAALRLIDQTSDAYKELEKALQGVGDKIRVNADLHKHLADPTLNKVLKTYLAMGPALRSAGKELQVIARLQKNLEVSAGIGGGLSYRYTQGVPGRAKAIFERQLDRGRLEDSLSGSLAARRSEIIQVLGGSGSRDDYKKEMSLAAQDEYARELERRSASANFMNYGNQRYHLSGNENISDDEKFSRLGQLGAAEKIESEIARKAAESGRNRGYYAAMDPQKAAGRIERNLNAQFPEETGGKLRAFADAATQMADAIRMKVTEMRTVHLDEELENLFRKMKDRQIDPYTFQKEVENTVNKKQASFAVSPLLQKIQAPADLVDEDLSKAQMQQKEFEEGLKSLTDLSGGLTEEQEKLVKTSRDMLQTNVDNAKAAVPLKERMNEIKSQTSALAAKRARGVKLTKDEIKITERLGAEYSALQSKVRVLTAGVNGHNVALHEGAVSSRRYNYMLQQVSYGMQDFVQVVGQTGLSGALRASANNVASVFGAMGNTGGALAGAGITFLMIGIAEAATSLGLESETAAEKLEKLNSRIESFVKARSQMASGRLELISEKGITSGRSVSDSMSSGLAVDQSRRKYEEAVDLALSDFIGGMWNSLWDTIERDLFTELMVHLEGHTGGKLKTSEFTKQMEVEQVAAAKLRGGKNSGDYLGSDGVIGLAEGMLRHIDKSKMTKADKALAEILKADADTLEGRIKILDILNEQGDISEKMKTAVSDAKKSMSDAMIELRNMTILSGEESLKIRQNIKKMETANLPKVMAGDLSVFEILREAQESAIEKIKQYNKLLADKTLPDDVRKNYETQRANVGAAKTASENAQARLQNAFVSQSRNKNSRDIMDSVAAIVGSSETKFSKDQKLKSLTQDFVESSRDGGARRQFGKTKQESINDMYAETDALANALTASGDFTAAKAVKTAADHLAQSMLNSRDEFEELAHTTDQFIKKAKESDIFTVGSNEALSGAAAFADRAKPLLDEIAELKAKTPADKEEKREIGLQIASKQAAVDNLRREAEAKLISAVSSGPNGILGGILQGVEDTSVARNSLIKGGAAPANVDSAAKGVIDQHIYDAIQGFSGKFAVKPGETQEEARMRFAKETDAAVATARQKEGTGELAAGTADAIKQAAILAIDKSQNQRQQVGLTSAENMWSSIQTSLSSPENYDKSQLDEAKKISQNTADIVTALKNGFTL